MTNKKIAESLLVAYRKVLEQSVYYDEDFIVSILLELVNQCSTSLPQDSNMDEFYARMYGSSEGVVYVDAILEICEELKRHYD